MVNFKRDIKNQFWSMTIFTAMSSPFSHKWIMWIHSKWLILILEID